MKKVLFAFAIAIGASVFGYAQAVQVAPTSMSELIAGTWVEYANWSARLELDPNGSGWLAIDTGPVTSTYRLTMAAPTGDGKIHFTSTPVSHPNARASVSAIVSGDSLALYVAQGDLHMQFWMRKESDVTDRAAKLKQAVESTRASP